MLKTVSENENLETASYHSNLDLNDFFLIASWFRLIIYLAVFVGTQLLQLLQNEFLTLDVWQPVHLMLFLAMVGHVVFLEVSTTKKKIALEYLFYIDAIVMASAIYFLDIYNAFFLFMLLTFIAISGTVLGKASALRVGLFGLAMINFAVFANADFQPHSFYATALVNHISVFVVIFLSGILHEQIQVIKKDFEIKNQEIKSLTNVNDLIVDHISSGIIVFDENFKITKANRGAVRIFGNLQLVDLQLQELFVELYNAATHFIANRNDARAKKLELNYYNIKKEKQIIETMISEILQPEGQNKLFLCVMQNVTEVRSLEFALQQKEKLAAVGRLAAGIAHEIRNPLASISGSVQLLQVSLQTQTPEDKKLLNIMIKEIDRLNRLITEFLDFVRPEVRVEDPININELVKDILEIVKLNPKLLQTVKQNTELQARSLIFGHHDKLKQALLNMVINSYQALTDTLRPEITIRTYDAENKLVLVIRDNGSGISKDQVSKIFEPFHTTKTNGTGLGLAITHKILESHNAEVFVESEIGQGTEFSIVFPVQANPVGEEMYMKKQA